MQTVQEVVDELIKMNNWWSESYAKATIELVDNCRNKISAYLVTLGTYVGDAKDDQLSAESARKVAHHQKRFSYITENDYAVGKAESKAVIDMKEQQDLADKSEAYYTWLKILLDQMNKVMEAMSQHIAIMRKELANVKS
jgi:hypothetical protein